MTLGSLSLFVYLFPWLVLAHTRSHGPLNSIDTYLGESGVELLEGKTVEPNLGCNSTHRLEAHAANGPLPLPSPSPKNPETTTI